MPEDLFYRTATELARMLRAKQVSATEVVQAHLDRIEAVNPLVNAVVTLTAEQALEQAREADRAAVRGEFTGPLHGLPCGAQGQSSHEGHPDHLRFAVPGSVRPR